MHVCDERFVSRIYGEFSQINNKKINNPIFKRWAKKFEQTIHQRRCMNKHMKRCWMMLVIREGHIKITM